MRGPAGDMIIILWLLGVALVCFINPLIAVVLTDKAYKSSICLIKICLLGKFNIDEFGVISDIRE